MTKKRTGKKRARRERRAAKRHHTSVLEFRQRTHTQSGRRQRSGPGDPFASHEDFRRDADQ